MTTLADHTFYIPATRLAAPGALAVACLAVSAMPATADDAVPGWEPGFTFVPYGWLAGIDGEVGSASGDLDPGGDFDLPERVDVSVDGELEEIGFMFFGEWRGERWHAFFDSVWVNVSQGGQIRLGNLLPATEANAGIDGNVYQLALGYRLFEGAATSMSLYGGARYYDIDAEVKLDGGLLPNGVTASTADSWTEGVIGTRWGYRITDSWQGVVLADMGFGESDFTWQVFASISWRFSDRGAIAGGYRYLSLDHETSDFKADLALYGPAVGLAFRF